jgi:hypothetical protein
MNVFRRFDGFCDFYLIRKNNAVVCFPIKIYRIGFSDLRADNGNERYPGTILYTIPLNPFPMATAPNT